MKRARSACRQADTQHPVEDPDRGGHATRFAHASLALESDLHALTGREAVRDERGLERDPGSPSERVTNLV